MFGAYYTQSRILRWFWRLVILGFPLVPRSISRWPKAFESIATSSSVVLLDVEMFSIACMVGGTNWGRYIMSLAVFPLGPLWLLVCFTSSRRLNKKHKLVDFFSTRQVKVFRFTKYIAPPFFPFRWWAGLGFWPAPSPPRPPLAPPLALLLVTHTSHPLPPNLPFHMSCASHQLPSQPKGPYPPCNLLRTLYFSCGSMIVPPPPT